MPDWMARENQMKAVYSFVNWLAIWRLPRSRRKPREREGAGLQSAQLPTPTLGFSRLRPYS